MKAKARARIALGAAMVVTAALLVFAGTLTFSLRVPVKMDPNPAGKASACTYGTSDGEITVHGVDWAYWQSVNSDVVGWITVPGTSIDYPIVQAPADDPDFYLSHDVYGNACPSGAAYLSVGCEGALEPGYTGTAIIMGHHWGRAMFGPLADYQDASFAEGHRVMVLQTPGAVMTLEVQAVDVIPGTDAVKRTDFATRSDLWEYWRERFEAAAVKLAHEAEKTDRLFLFATCSYSYWPDNERTLVYAVEEYAELRGGEAGEAD